jgi:hypothetical protein
VNAIATKTQSQKRYVTGVEVQRGNMLRQQMAVLSVAVDGMRNSHLAQLEHELADAVKPHNTQNVG